jgi:hypothetical protein
MWLAKPLELAGVTLLDLVKFNDAQRQKRFVEKVTSSLEDLSYMFKVAGFELYKIVDVKCNTPIIGHFAKKKLQDAPLPNHYSDCATLIDEVKETLLAGWGMANLEYLDLDSDSTSDLELAKRYRKNFPEKSKVLKEFVSNPNPPSLNKSTSVGKVTRGEKLNRDMGYSFNPYNNFIETCVGVVGSLVNYVCSWFG